MQLGTTTSNRPLAVRRPAASRLCIACSLTLVMVLGACGKADDGRTVGQNLDAAVASTTNAATELKSEVKESAVNAGTAIQAATEQAKAAAAQTGSNVAATLDDAAITASVSAGLAKDPDLSAIKIDVDTANGTVSIYGPAPTESARARATEIARAVKGVVGVNNKLTVKSG